MFSISKYLNKFKNISSSEIILKNDLIKILKKELNIEIDKKNIEIKKGVVFLKIHPILKNEIYLNKEKILEILRKKIKIKDIK